MRSAGRFACLGLGLVLLSLPACNEVVGPGDECGGGDGAIVLRESVCPDGYVCSYSAEAERDGTGIGTCVRAQPASDPPDASADASADAPAE